MAEEEAPKTEGKGKGKGSAFFKKNKTAIIAASILLGVALIYLLSHRSNAAASTSAAQTAASGAIDPSTGYLYGTPADLAASGSSGATTSVPGPAGAAGPAGPTGPTGPAGPAGKTVGPPTPKQRVPVPVHKPPVPNPPHRTYKVEAGDNLSSIASKLHVSGGWQSLYKTNRSVIGGNPNLIKPGQTLHY